MPNSGGVRPCSLVSMIFVWGSVMTLAVAIVHGRMVLPWVKKLKMLNLGGPCHLCINLTLQNIVSTYTAILKTSWIWFARMNFETNFSVFSQGSPTTVGERFAATAYSQKQRRTGNRRLIRQGNITEPIVSNSGKQTCRDFHSRARRKPQAWSAHREQGTSWITGDKLMNIIRA